MRRPLITLVALLSLVIPHTSIAQSGDATWLNGLNGLQSAIGRSWMAPMEMQLSGSDSATPTSPEHPTLMLSALVFAFDSPDHAEEGLRLLNAEQMQQLERDPRSPATNEFSVDDLGDLNFGHEGTFGGQNSGEIGIVYLMVQDGNLVYQVFGQFRPGDHRQITVDVAQSMTETEAGSSDEVYDAGGGSTGGFWEKLNAIDLDMTDGSAVSDLEIFPVSDDAVLGNSVVVPEIDLTNLGQAPGLIGSWHVSYTSHAATELVGTPPAGPPGVFSIELWVLEFSDATQASAATFSLNDALNEPLGIVTTDGSGFSSSNAEGITMVNSGFVRDRSLPDGDAATVIFTTGTTVYAARVYANGPAPTPIAQDLVSYLQTTDPGTAAETVTATTHSGGMWEKFPASGSDAVFGLEQQGTEVVNAATPSATPAD